MPQEIRVVQCYGCQMYQVDIVKKVNKWTCKLCGEKQSLKTVIFQGSGKECRLRVQKLNGSKGSTEQNRFSEVIDGVEQSSAGLRENVVTETQSNWSHYVDDNDDAMFEEAASNISSNERTPNQDNEPENIVKCTDIRGKSKECNNVVSGKNSIEFGRNDEKLTVCSSSEIDVRVVEATKVETIIAAQSEWDQYLQDELSD